MGSEGPLSSELKVDVQKPVMILPAEATEECTLFLSNIDQVLAYYVQTVYFYAKGGDKAADLLRDSLSKLLVPYHFLAGRLKLNLVAGRMELECNRAGVLFAGASCGLSISDLGDISMPNPLFANLVLPPADGGQVASNAPLITIQVTKFKCGGFSMGVSMSHAVVDGIGALEFFMNFCSVTRGEGLQIFPKPDRTMLKARDPPQITFEHKEYIKLSELLAAQSAFTSRDAANSELVNTSAPQTHIYRSFSFTPERIAELKARACEDGVVNKCSTFEVVVAHIWQARTKAVNMDPESPSKLFFAVDVRNKLVPPLPKGFAGNGVVSAPCVTTLAGEICSNPLSFCVRRVQEAMAAVTDEYVRSSIDHGEIHRGVPALPGGIFISPWWRIPFQELDLGWGKPMYAGPVVNEKVEFVLLLHNGKHDGGLNAYLALQPAEMEQFEILLRD